MAKVLGITISKTHEWGEDAGKNYIVKPEEIPEDNVYESSEFVSRLYPGQHIVSIAKKKIFGRSSFGYGDKGTYSLFFKTLQTCFNEHLPFSIRPEVLWYLVVHEVSQAVKLNPERYRHHFTNSDDKEAVEIKSGEVLPSDWGPFVKQFAEKISDKMPSDLSSLLRAEFTTSNLESSVATDVIFMDTASPYFDYRWQLCCGLPLIRLDGDPADYHDLVERAKTLKVIFGKDLGEYFTHLIPVLTTIAEQASGAPVDNEFWGAIYNHNSGSGGSDGSDNLGGWITAFVNYVRMVKDSGVTIEPKPSQVYDWTMEQRWLSVGMVPNHVSAADFILTSARVEVEVKMKLVGGVLGVEIDDGFVSPQLSYGVLVDKEYIEEIEILSK